MIIRYMDLLETRSMQRIQVYDREVSSSLKMVLNETLVAQSVTRFDANSYAAYSEPEILETDRELFDMHKGTLIRLPRNIRCVAYLASLLNHEFRPAFVDSDEKCFYIYLAGYSKPLGYTTSYDYVQNVIEYLRGKVREDIIPNAKTLMNY